jgi:hypothetical protein
VTAEIVNVALTLPNKIKGLLLEFFWRGRPGPTKPLAALRIGAALIALVQACAALPYLDDLIGSTAIIQPEVARFFIHPASPNIDGILVWLTKQGLTPEVALHLLWGVWIFLLLLLLAGCGTPVVAWLVWLTHLAIKSSGAAASYGVSEFLNILFFYIALGPAGELWSVDSLGRRRRRRWAWQAGLILRVMRLHLCAVYLSSGLEKAFGPEWWNGEALWRALGREDLFLTASYLVAMPWLLRLMGWWTVAIEIGYTPMILWPRTRWFWLAQVAMLHLGIAISLNLWLFSAAMLLFNAVAFAPLWDRKSLTKLGFNPFSFLARFVRRRRRLRKILPEADTAR